MEPNGSIHLPLYNLHRRTKMSLFSEVATGLSKAASFIVEVFTKGDQVVKTFESLSPQTKAAMLATFYDVTTTLTTGAEAAGAAASGNIPTAFTLSETTLTLLESVKSDLETDGSVVLADLKALGIIKPAIVKA
jgi:hypothetical protein